MGIGGVGDVTVRVGRVVIEEIVDRAARRVGRSIFELWIALKNFEGG